MGSITDVKGVLVGHAQDNAALTGCTVVLIPDGAVAGVDVRGSAPGTRETDLMRPCNLVERIQAVVLSGGSAFGLDAAGGVMEYLAEQGIGFATEFGVVPIVGSAVIYDLGIGDGGRRPDRVMGRAACIDANSEPCAEGNVGAGTGATVGKMLGSGFAMKGGLGSWSDTIALPDGSGIATVAAIVVVNALGDVVDPWTGHIQAGAFDRGKRAFVGPGSRAVRCDRPRSMAGGNTTIAVVATDVILDKEGANKVAQMAHDGLARAVVPAHTMYDGDTVFCVATGRRTLWNDRAADVTAVGAMAAEVLAQATVRAVKAAESVGGYPSISDVSHA